LEYGIFERHRSTIDPRKLWSRVMTSPILRSLALAALTVIGSAGAAAAMAHGGGGGGGGGGHGGGGSHGGGGFHSGGSFHGGGYRGGPGSHGGYYGGWRGGYGGWRGGYYGYGYGYGYGLGWLGYGLAFSTLPLYYDTYWWDGAPYYYADDNYYVWDGNSDAYETVPPPAGLQAQVAAAPPSPHADPKLELFAYPKNGQTAVQQARDVSECRKWATGQAGSDAAKHADYLRAEDACLSGRGYSVR
jgi:hypothetical protein